MYLVHKAQAHLLLDTHTVGLVPVLVYVVRVHTCPLCSAVC